MIRAGIVAAALVAAVVVVPLVAVAWTAAGLSALTPGDWGAVRFTLWQAAWSAAISVLLAVPVARALARRRFAGRRALIVLLGAPFILPVIVAVLGLIAVFGRSGWVSAGFGLLGLPPLSVYGPWGVVLAHVFLNMPLAVRFVLQGWASVPAERFRLAASLGMDSASVFRTIEVPMLARVLPGVALVIFVICTGSFAAALALGGGPSATTVELAIYQAFRFDFDPGRAASLALIQLGLTAVLALLALRARLPDAPGLGRATERFDGAGRRWVDALWIAFGAAFLILPLAALAARGLPGVAALPGPVWSAAARSALVAAGSAAAVTMLALAVAVAVAGLRGPQARAVEVAAMSGLAASPLVLGTGAFVLLVPVTDPARWALAVTGAANAVAALPFALRAVVPAVIAAEAGHGRLADGLGLRGAARLRHMILPMVKRPLAFAGGLTAALSMGDLGVVTLFADPDRATLPLALFRLMGAYRTDDAAAAAVLLVLLSLGAFAAFEAWGRRC